MPLVLLILRLILATALALAAVGKLLDMRGSRQALVAFGVPRRATAVGAWALPAVEALIAVGLLIPSLARAAAFAASVLFLAFVAGSARLLRRGEAPDCHCFGSIHSEPVGPATLVRAGGLAVMALAVAAGGAGREWDSFGGTALALVLVAWAAVGLAVAAALLARENAELRKRPRSRPAGLPTGSAAPQFTLPDVRGGEVSLDRHLDAGRRVILTFVSPSCGPCEALLPDVARWQRSLLEHVAVLVISSGEEDANRAVAEEHGLESLLLAPPQVSGSYGVQATPTAVLVEPDGTVGSAAAAGGAAIEALVRIAVRRAGATPPAPSPPRLHISHQPAPSAGG
jgi:peroxiredoxin